METGEHPVVVALPERETAGVEAEVIRDELDGTGGDPPVPEHAGVSPPTSRRAAWASPRRRAAAAPRAS